MDPKKKRTTSLSLSSSRAKPTMFTHNKKSPSLQISNCNFCQEKVSKHNFAYFSMMTNKALYSKYSSSQNYYYTKDINDILANAKVPSVIFFRDIEVFEECEEYLKRFYRGAEYDGKIKMLTEYYKYHQDIPRLFMFPIINTLNRYHDKKRRLDYLRITKMLRDQNDDKKAPKGRDVRRSIKSDYIPITDRVLAELELTQSSNIMKSSPLKNEDLIKVEGNWRADLSSAGKTSHSGSLKAYRDKLGFAINKKLMKEADRTMEQARDASVSNTLHDLNMKLGEIINKSYSVANFENSEYQANNTISNLDNFLNYMQDNHQSARLNRIPEITSVIKPSQSRPSQHEIYRSDAPEPESRVYASKNTLDVDSIMDTHHRTNLAERLLKNDTRKPAPSHQPKSGTIVRNVPETERPFTALAASKQQPTVAPTMISSALGNQIKPTKNMPMTVLKIQNFEEVLKARQASPIKISSQRSVSTEKTTQKRPPSAVSHRAYNNNYTGTGVVIGAKESNKKPKSRQEEMMAQRRSSQAAHNDYMEVSNSSRVLLKTRSSFNKEKTGIYDRNTRNTEYSTLVTHQFNDPPNSHREMRICLDVNSATKPNSGTGSINTSRTMTTAGTRTSQTKVIPTNILSSHERTKSMRTTHQLATNNSKDIRGIVGLCQINLQDAANNKSVNRSSTSKTGIVRPPPASSRLEYSGSSTNMSPIPEQDMLKFKMQFVKLNKNNIQQQRHKSTKSEVRFFDNGALDLSKKTSPMQAPISSRDRNPSPFELAKYERENLTARPQIYNYNTNNIVNIFVNPANQEKSRDAKSVVGKVEPKRTGSLTDRDRDRYYASNPAGVKIVSHQNKPIGSEVFMKYNQNSLIRRDSSNQRESPVMILKKEEPVKLSRSKSGNLGSFVNTANHAAKSALHSKIQKKIELDLMEEMRSTPDSYEFLVNFRSKR